MKGFWHSNLERSLMPTRVRVVPNRLSCGQLQQPFGQGTHSLLAGTPRQTLLDFTLQYLSLEGFTLVVMRRTTRFAVPRAGTAVR